MEPKLSVCPQFKGAVTFHDLLSAEGTVTFITDRSTIRNDGLLFNLLADNFILSVSIQNESIVFQRNETVSVCTLSGLKEISRNLRVILIWTYTELIIDCGYSYETRKVIKVNSNPSAPPSDLIKWARLNDLIRRETYKTEIDLRNTVYSALQTVNKKISESDSYKTFLNISYDGNKIIKKEPKKEIEIQPIIQCILSDIFLLNGIEVIPEYKTGQGNIDFAFLGFVESLGNRKICVEFKLAHSTDLENGLLVQLPVYMKISGSEFGAYCVLNFFTDDEQLVKYNRMKLDFYLNRLADNSGNPLLQNVRVFIFDLNKPLSASVINA